MAINAYVGLMGHGKTYQAVKSVIVQKYFEGRNIVTNIEGINIENINKYLLDKYKDSKIEDFGTITIIKDDDITKPDFFPFELYGEDGNVLESKNGICQSGDLIVIDEAWKYWNSTEKLHKQHETFFRKMRHYVNDKGHTSDLVIITQDHTVLNRSLKNLIEMIFVTKKIKTLGSKSENSFTLTIFEGNKLTKSSQISHTVNLYDKDIFPLYKSYSKANAKEVLVDSRVNYFKGAYFKYSMIAAGLCIIIPLWFFYDFYKSYQEKAAAHEKALIEKQTKKADVDNKTPGTSSSSSLPSENKPTSAFVNNDLKKPSTSIRITGAVFSENRFIIFIKENESVKMIVNPKCFGSGYTIACNIDNEVVTY